MEDSATIMCPLFITCATYSCPHVSQVIPFHQRVSIFQSLLQKDKASVFSADGGLAAAMGLQGGSVRIEVE